MNIQTGKGSTEYGTGIDINLTGDELAEAITLYLQVRHNICVYGARAASVNGERCESANVYVDPSGVVLNGDTKISGRDGEEIPDLHS